MIQSEQSLSQEGLLPIGVQIRIPDVLKPVLPYITPILPDSEVVYGSTIGDFDVMAYALEQGGFLISYSEELKGEILQGPEIVHLVAMETSTNPRLLLAFLEYQSGWVLGHPPNAVNDRFPIGYNATAGAGLYNELMITARILAQGFYGWRDGSRVELAFADGARERLSPGLNAGSTALMSLFAVLYPRENWEVQLFGGPSFLNLYQDMFGDYWGRSAVVGPSFLNTTRQPELMLPFAVGEAWSLTAGPHITWQTGTPRGAVDFAPITGETPCAVSTRWVTAAAPGLVVRSERGVVAIDLDGDNDEGTGWVLIYLHIAKQGRVSVGTWLDQDTHIGHPSCEGGQASGTHVHFARKFNGEWIGAGEPLPLILSGWQAFAGTGRYEGVLQKGDVVVSSRPTGSAGSTIIREE
jgi:LasA protease